MHQNDLRINFPKTFSFIEDPNTTLETIELLVSSLKNNIGGTFHFDQSNINTLDFCAEAVIAAIANKMRVSLEGTYPKDNEQKEIVATTGLPNVLGVNTHLYKDLFLIFPLKHGRKEIKYAHSLSESRDKIASQFLNYVNNCFRVHGFELNDVYPADVQRLKHPSGFFLLRFYCFE